METSEQNIISGFNGEIREPDQGRFRSGCEMEQQHVTVTVRLNHQCRVDLDVKAMHHGPSVPNADT